MALREMNCIGLYLIGMRKAQYTREIIFLGFRDMYEFQEVI